MNFVFVADVADDAQVVPNDEFSAYRWVDRQALSQLESPLNVREFGYLALDARPASIASSTTASSTGSTTDSITG